MKIKSVALLGLLVVPAMTGLGHPAFAQSASRTNLPDASHIQRAPLRIQLIDPNPIITDTRKREEDTTYMIHVPPMPVAKHQVVEIGQPVDAGATGGTHSGVNPVNIRTNHLPGASFQSNIPAQGTALGRDLPNGSSSNGLKNVMAHNMLPTPRTSGSPGAGAPGRSSSPAQSPARSTTFLMYSPSASANIGSAHEATTKVIGKKIQKYSLLSGQ